VTALEQRDLTELTIREQDVSSVESQVLQGSGLWRRRRWFIALAAVATWSVWGAVAGPRRVLNSGGWSQVQRFVSAAVHPDLSRAFLEVVVRSAATTAGYALVGTALALCIGTIGGVLSSEVWWARDSLDRAGRPTRRPLTIVRLAAVVPRGIHEAIWALAFVYILGRNPLVAVLAIGVPFGAITAKVVADTIDDSARDAVLALRVAGAGRVAAMAYGVAPIVLRDVVSYGFYRLECALRSSVVLGAIGAGGLGFQLSVSFQSLRYREIWTLIYALVIMSALADRWGASLRHRPSRRWMRVSVIAATVLTVVAAVSLQVRPTTLFAGRARRLARSLASQAWPPRLPKGGWATLTKAVIDTVQLSVIAIVFAALVATPLAFLAARPEPGSAAALLASRLARFVLLIMRSIPPTVWALMVLFVVFPGPLPGGIALGCYTIGVLGRLDAEVVENSDRHPYRALRNAGVPATASFAYGTLPTVAPRLTSLAMYRWEVAARETVIVGLVGAGGLGRLLAQQNAAFDEAAMLTSVAALVVVSTLIDMVSRRVRLALR
jgi:phosphonate transport system permease protein